MVLLGHVRNGLIVADGPVSLPEGAAVRIELVVDNTVLTASHEMPRRQGGWWRGQVVVADDFDALPDDLAEAFGMKAQ